MNKFTTYRARFKGELNNIKVNQLMNLDYDINNFNKRIEFINNKLEVVNPFYEEYFDIRIIEDEEVKREISYFNYSPNVDEELSEDINICKYLEGYANYLLNSKDLPRERQQKYNILSEEDFKKILRKEVPLSSFNENGDIENDECIDILDTRRENDYTNMDFRILKSDFEDEEIKDVLISYQIFKDYLREQLLKNKNNEEFDVPLTKAKNLLAGINDDMILSKIKLKQIRCHAKRLGDESPMNDMSEIDYTNSKHIKHILRNCTFGNIEPDNEMSLMAYDLEVAIRELYKNKKLDDIDIKIVELYNSRVQIKEISKKIKRNTRVVHQRIDKITKRISGFYKK